MATHEGDPNMADLPPKKKLKDRLMLYLAKRVEPSPAQRKKLDEIDDSTTWRELGFDIDEAPKTPGKFASKKQFDIWCKRSARAERLEKAGKIDEAIALYEKGVSENTELPGDYHRLSVIYAKRGDLKKAIGYCDLALKSPACTNPAQDVARRDFRERKKKLEARLKAKGAKKE